MTRSAACMLRKLILVAPLALLLASTAPVSPGSPVTGRGPRAASEVLGGAAQASGVGAPSGWAAQIQQNLAEQEYEISSQSSPADQSIGASWQAPNRAHGFRTYFTSEGIRVVPRDAQVPSWRWGLTLVGYGQGEMGWDVESATLAPSGRRIDYHRGVIEESYQNSPEGLEQRFVLSAKPGRPESGKSSSGLIGWATPLRPRPVALTGAGGADEAVPTGGHARDSIGWVHLDLALWGDLTPRISEDGQAIDFVTASGAPALHYAQLKVTDARGKHLSAWMEGFTGRKASGIRIVIDAREASFPIVVDPLATAPSWMVTGGQMNARFATVVATAGDVDGDGYSDILVGSPYYDNGQTDEGRVYLYRGTPTGLSLTPAWTAELDKENAYFGFSVATAGDVNGDGYSDVIAGAWEYLTVTSTGRVVVYLGSAAGLSATPNWTVDGPFFSNLGYSVSTAGDVNGDGYSDVIVGVLGHAAYVYLGSSSGLAGTPASTLVSDPPNPLGYYAAKVATAGDVNGDGYADVLVGDELYSNGESSEGKAYLYLGTPTGVDTTPAWTVESNNFGAFLGYALATAGDVNGDGYADVITGAYGYTANGVRGGQAALYLGSASGLAATPAWTFVGDRSSEDVGFSVSTAGDVNGDGYADVTIGAPGYTNPETSEGAAFLFMGSASGLHQGYEWKVEGNLSAAGFGGSVATAGDVNGDGYADVLVGAPYYDGASTDQGAAFLYLGSPAGVASGRGWFVPGDQTDAFLGWSVATAGDVNGDGYADVIVGAPNYDNGQTDEGRAYAYLGGASGLASTPAWTAEGNQDGAGFGISVATAGDVNRDGYSDIIVGAAGLSPTDFYSPGDGSITGAGRASVYLGSPSGPAANPVWTAVGDQDGALFGISVASAGDVNGDGFFDVLVGAERYSHDQISEGRAYLYLGSPLGPSATPGWTAESNGADALFGHVVASAGDVNRDGYSDVIVSAYKYDDATTGGRLDLYLGSPSGLSTSPVWTQGGEGPAAWFGFSIAGAGDVNGDGYSDIIVGSPNLDQLNGAAYVYMGTASGIPEVTWSIYGGGLSYAVGWPVAGAGDVNGDGFSDVVLFIAGSIQDYNYVFLGSPAGPYSGGTISPSETVATAGDINGDGYADIIEGTSFGGGSAETHYGNRGPGLSLNPRQRQSDFFGFKPIAPGGRSNVPGSFALQTTGRTPFGRSSVLLEWEIKPLGMPLNGLSILSSSSSTDTGTAGANLIEQALGFNPGSYHWRLRLRYDSAKTPFAQRSRWLTTPWHGWQEAQLTLGAFLGGWVWDDLDGDGVRDEGEPGRGGAAVSLLSSSGAVVDQRTTIADGYYSFAVPGAASSFQLGFQPPAGTALTLQDQGGDDTIDSDPDPAMGLTSLIGPGFTFLDDVRWSAGLICNAPTLPVFIAGARGVPGTPNLILDITDPNSASRVTGYNVYRANQPQPPPSPWTLLSADVTDNDTATPSIQWLDTSGATPALGAVFFYQVTAFNHVCAAEGPR